MYTKAQLITQLREMGIRSDDTIAIHISLKSLGQLDTSEMTGAELVIAALREAVSEGLLLVPAHTFRNIREEPVFDVRTTMPCVGALPGVAVKLANEAFDRGDATCVRSLHPSHSVVAFGKNAREYVADDIRAVTPTPEFGCYGKLRKVRGKILLIGVDLHNNTYFHSVDQTLSPERVSEPFQVRFTDYEGNVTGRTARNCRGVPAAHFMNYFEDLDAAGAIGFGQLGDAKVMLCDPVIGFEVLEKLHKEGKF